MGSGYPARTVRSSAPGRKHVGGLSEASLNNLLGYPHRKDAVRDEMIGASREDLDRVFRKWRGDAAAGLW